MIFPLRVLGRSVTMYYGSAGFGVEGESGQCDVYRVGLGKTDGSRKKLMMEGLISLSRNRRPDLQSSWEQQKVQ